MKKLLIAMLAIAFAVGFSNCNKEEDDDYGYTGSGSGTGTGTGSGSGSGSGIVEEDATPVANFSFTGSNQYAPCAVSFTNLSTNATSYEWDFGDGGTSTLKNPSHTYTGSGVYSVALKAKNGTKQNVITKTVNVKNNPTTWSLTQLKLTAYPETDGSTNWDLTDGGPDIYFKILNASNTVLYTSSTKDGCTQASLPLTWSVSGLTLTDINATYTIKFYDEDGALDADDLMATITFKPANYSFNTTSSSWTAYSGEWAVTWNYAWGGSK